MDTFDKECPRCSGKETSADNSVTPSQPDSVIAPTVAATKKNKLLLFAAVVFVVSVIIFATGLFKGGDTLIESGPAFDVPALIGKDVTAIEAIFGPPTKFTPIEGVKDPTGTKESDATWEKDGISMMVTYRIADDSVVDLSLIHI